MNARITRINTNEGTTTVDIEWSGDDAAVTDFDLARLGKIATGIGAACGGNMRSGWVVLDGRCALSIGSEIPHLQAMNAQHQSSITHAKNLAAGLSVADHAQHGDGDRAVSLVRYSDGSTWYFDNASGQRLDQVYGWRSANAAEEPAWFLTMADAESFDRDCGALFGAPEAISADDADLADIQPPKNV
jgi:hypothetical protein